MKALPWILLTASLGVWACGGPKGYVIRGEVTGFPDSTMFYLTNSYTEKIEDSTLVIGGRFQMQGILEKEPSQIWLNASVDQRYVYISLLMGNESVELKGDIADFPRRVAVSGSKYQDQLKIFQDVTLRYDLQRDSLVASYMKLPNELRDAEEGQNIWKQIRPIDRVVDSLGKDYLFTQTNTYPALITLGYKMYAYPKDTVQMLFDRMSPELQTSRYGNPIRTFLACETVAEGDPFHDFEAEDQNGRKLRLSELVGGSGKYTLLDFTAAGCGPCMMAAKEMRRMVDTYSDSLRIVSFSVDNRKNWEQSLVRDSVSWTSLWSEKEKESGEICIPYQVRGYPTFFLIDPQGKIVQRWSGYGPDIFEEKIGRLKNK